jgi:4-hydroxy-tetrahydrodipicolinate synthase
MAGATGWAPVCTNFMPRDAMKFFDAAVGKRDASTAQNIWDKLFPICDIICTKSHIRVAHTGLDILGRPVGPPRRPLRMLNDEDRTKLKSALIAAGAMAP